MLLPPDRLPLVRGFGALGVWLNELRDYLLSLSPALSQNALTSHTALSTWRAPLAGPPEESGPSTPAAATVIGADFSWVLKNFGEPIAPVQFTDRSQGSPEAWLWTFGDGNTSTEQNPLHSFVYVPGASLFAGIFQYFTVRLTITKTIAGKVRKFFIERSVRVSFKAQSALRIDPATMQILNFHHGLDRWNELLDDAGQFTAGGPGVLDGLVASDGAAGPNLNVAVSAGDYMDGTGTRQTFAGGNIDLGPASPPVPFDFPFPPDTSWPRGDIVFLDADGVLQKLSGAINLHAGPEYPAFPADSTPIAYVLVAAAATTIADCTIRDARLWINTYIAYHGLTREIVYLRYDPPITGRALFFDDPIYLAFAGTLLFTAVGAPPQAKGRWYLAVRSANVVADFIGGTDVDTPEGVYGLLHNYDSILGFVESFRFVLLDPPGDTVDVQFTTPGVGPANLQEVVWDFGDGTIVRLPPGSPADWNVLHTYEFDPEEDTLIDDKFLVFEVSFTFRYGDAGIVRDQTFQRLLKIQFAGDPPPPPLDVTPYGVDGSVGDPLRTIEITRVDL